MAKEKLGNELIVKDKDIEIIQEKFNNKLLIKDKELELQIEKLQSELKLKDRDLEIINLKYKMLEDQMKTFRIQTIAQEL